MGLASEKNIEDTQSPGTREALIDSGITILNFSTGRKVLSLLRSMTGLDC